MTLSMPPEASTPLVDGAPLEDALPDPLEHPAPVVPKVVRTAIYALALVWGTVATVVAAGAAIWWPETTQEVLGTVGAISSGVAFLTGATGVAYRPTAPGVTPNWHAHDPLE